MEEIIIIDNYDSFTYNLVHYFEGISKKVIVFRNDAVDYSIVDQCSHIVLSPGPGLPKNAGDSLKIIEKYYKQKSILGICLGHQCIGSYFGHQLSNLSQVLHGKQKPIQVNDHNCLYENLPSKFNIGHYHSWVINEKENSDLNVTARLNSGEIMSVRHKEHNVFGTQFHPESILTEYGKLILINWLKLSS